VIQKIFESDGDVMHLPSSADYMFLNFDKFIDPNYVVSDDDIVHCRVKTTGAVETVFKFKGRIFVVVDVGGQVLVSPPAFLPPVLLRALLPPSHPALKIEVVSAINAVSFLSPLLPHPPQRSERRKWLHCFTDVDAVLYLAAIDEYDKTLEEDHNANALQESLELLEVPFFLLLATLSSTLSPLLNPF
jgi:hypothetical protein